VDGDLQPAGGRLDESARNLDPLRRGKHDALPGRPERQQPVEPVAGKKVDVRIDGAGVKPSAPERRDGSRQRPAQHERDSKLLAVPDNLRTERDGDVLRITFTRPDRRNAFDAALIAELAEAFVAVGRARAVVLGGDGPSFSAGADVDWMRSSVDLSYEENVADANALRAMLEAIDGCPAPVVARVQGHALGGGAGLVAAADIAIAAPDTVFAFSEVKLGIIPAVISPFALAKIGPGAARRYFVTGERFDSATALRIGLVHEVADDLDGAVEAVVGELLSAGPQAARWAKRLVRERPDGPETARWIAERRTSEEGQEGLRAFLEKRPASWRG
jgi:methylglutaconyl-CoA hydratase